MTVSKKDFEEIAKILNEERLLNGEVVSLNSVLNGLSNYFKSENPRFDEVRFKEACLK